tara:strand:+ start:1500 stop:1820 length:321 start_codon:yes stop_codon:yes gene_type:complete
MKNTNEIEKQLQQKADKYIKQKAEEMFQIHKEIAEYLGTTLPSFIDYISNYLKYKQAISADKDNFFESSSPPETQYKYERELSKNYKKRLVAKYTKELIAKLEMFE